VDEYRYIYNWFNGNLRQGYHIHHKDGNPQNNYSDNLEQIEAKLHMCGVYERMRKEGKITNASTNPWTLECRAKMSRYMKARHQSERTDKICLICGKVYTGIKRQKFCSDCKNRQRNYRDKIELAQMINHKVVSVEFFGYGDTYNLEIDTYHNFVANGIMVHNCMNAGEYIAVNMFSPIEHKKPYRRLQGFQSISSM
jgi:hypothetical protein